MNDFLRNIGQVVVALWQLGRRRRWVPRAWDFYALWTSRLARLALIVVIGQPIAVILMSLTGVHELTVLTALTPIVALLFLLVVASMPQHQDELAIGLAVTAGLSAWDRTAKILGTIIRGLILFLLLDLTFGLYFSLLPVEEDRGLILWIVLMGVIFLLAVALQPPNRRKAILNWAVGILLVGSAIAVFVLFPVLLLNGGWEETKSDVAKALKDDAKAAPAEVKSSGTWQVTLRGPEEWVSTGVNLDRLPGDLPYSFGGPAGTKIRFVDERDNILAEGLITEDFGVQGGTPEFAGVTGATATLRVAN